MNKKETVKKIVGYKNILRIKKLLGVKKYFLALMSGKIHKVAYDEDFFCKSISIRQKNKNVFFGYYDLRQIDDTGKRVLVHIVDKGANPVKDTAKLAWVDLRTEEFHVFSETAAWSWQQGARLRWHPTSKNSVMYNDCDGKRYVTRVYDLGKESITETIPVPLYDIDPSGEYGLSLNFSRLQRLRPGYGYGKIIDTTAGQAAPESDGIYLWKKSTNEVIKIISLPELAEKANVKDAEHYINHISFSPSGRQFMFFHLWSYGLGTKWGMRLYVSDIAGHNVKCIEDGETISHYCWLDDNTLLTTALANDIIRHARYVSYDIANNVRTDIQSEYLMRDGHPTYIECGRRFISDTYPQDDSMQRVFVIDSDGKNYSELINVYADPFLFDEHRCDLHPRVDERHEMICIDTTYTGLRSVILFDGKKSFRRYNNA